MRMHLFFGRGNTSAPLSFQVTAAGSFNQTVNVTCSTSIPSATCTLTPGNPLVIPSGGTANLTATVNIPNDATPGAYNIKVSTQDMTGAPSHSATVSLTLAQDFHLTSATLSQTVTVGQTSGPYALTVQPVGSSFTGAVTLACTAGLPAGSQCIFNPSTPVTPGDSAVDVVMNISTAASSGAKSSRSPSYGAWVLLPGMLIVPIALRRSKRRLWNGMTGTLLVVMTILFGSCSGVSNSGGGGNQPPNPVTYHITVTGTSPGTPADPGQSVVVTLVVD